MKFEFDVRTAEAFHKAVPHLMELVKIQEEEGAAYLTEVLPYRTAEADGIVKVDITPTVGPGGQVSFPGVGSLVTDLLAPLTTGSPKEPNLDPLAVLAGASVGAGATATTPGASLAPPSSELGVALTAVPDPLASLAASAATGSQASNSAPPAPETAPAALNPLDGLVMPGAVAHDFVVFTATGERRAGFSDPAAAVKVFVHDLGLVFDQAGLDALWNANQPLYERVERGPKSSMSRGYTKRQEELQSVLTAMMGTTTPTPENPDSPVMTQDEFFQAFSKLAAKTGAQATVNITKVFSQFGATNFEGIPPSQWAKALEMIQQVVDNKG